MVTGNGLDEKLRERIRKLKIAKEVREEKERRNNIVIKGWQVPKNDLLETTVEEMLKKELKVDAIVVEAF